MERVGCSQSISAHIGIVLRFSLETPCNLAAGQYGYFSGSGVSADQMAFMVAS